jgi:hypothetical protein
VRIPSRSRRPGPGNGLVVSELGVSKQHAELRLSPAGRWAPAGSDAATGDSFDRPMAHTLRGYQSSNRRPGRPQLCLVCKFDARRQQTARPQRQEPTDPAPVIKVRSSAGNGQCVEIASATGKIAICDSKDPDGPILVHTPGEFRAFLDGARKGEFDGFVN